ncbi:hypothetical protein F2P79_017393, partial [Pimephales promelas]
SRFKVKFATRFELEKTLIRLLITRDQRRNFHPCTSKTTNHATDPAGKPPFDATQTKGIPSATTKRKYSRL